MARSADGISADAAVAGRSRKFVDLLAELVLAVEPGAGHACGLGDVTVGGWLAAASQTFHHVLGPVQGRVVAGLCRVA